MRCHLTRITLSFIAALFLALPHAALALTDAELDSIGKRVWNNECGGTRDGLTAWGSGENFPSLGIGHFIWYPKGMNGPFSESFPDLVKFLGKNGVKTPAWLDGDSPWNSRKEFYDDFKSARMTELRDLLASTIRPQSRFLAERMRQALPKMLAAAPASQRANIQTQFDQLAATGQGMYALIDYTNFKGEGVLETERYKGEGWGLLQVLAGMSGSGTQGATREFAESSAAALTRRVKNAPADRQAIESKWLAGWKNRCHGYAD